jgi:probable HAF family extracellular repeat protein
VTRSLIRSLAVVGLVSAVAGCSLVPTRFTSIDFPGAVSTHPRGINNSGQSGVASIVGYYVDSNGTVRAFKRGPGTTFVQINIASAIEAKAFGINNVGLGNVVGTVRDASGQHAFLWDGSTVTVPGNPPIPNGSGINDDGQMIVGFFSDQSGKQHGFTFPPGPNGPINVFNSLPTQTFGINNTRRMVGTLQETTGEFHAFYLSGPDIASAQRINIQGATRSDAYGINNSGDPAQVRHVGTFTIGGVDHAFVHTSMRGVETFDFPGALQTRAFGINDAGEIVGEYVDSNGRIHGFLGTFQ